MAANEHSRPNETARGLILDQNAPVMRHGTLGEPFINKHFKVRKPLNSLAIPKKPIPSTTTTPEKPTVHIPYNPTIESSPLRFHIPSTILQTAQTPRTQLRWSFKLYRTAAGDSVRVHYCTDIRTSENVAQRFLGEKVLGFDMEWKPFFKPGAQYASFKEAASLIQLASESEIALFHIAMHTGSSPEEVLAPSLREILENPGIAKTGVNVVRADGARLKRYLGLQPAGLFELSDLYGLVKDFPEVVETPSRRLVGLAKQVGEYLGLPMAKGKVRTSDWSKASLNQTQILYAASDAYAGYMLYRIMDNKRLMLTPPPPRPSTTSLGNPSLAPPLEPTDTESGAYTQTQPNPEEESPSTSHFPLRHRLSNLSRPTPPPPTQHPPAPTTSVQTRRLTSALSALLIRLSQHLSLPASTIASPSTLQALALAQPRTKKELEGIEGAVLFSECSSGCGVDLLRFVGKYGGGEGVGEEGRGRGKGRVGREDGEARRDNEVRGDGEVVKKPGTERWREVPRYGYAVEVVDLTGT